MATTHDFATALAYGEEKERELDAFFEERWGYIAEPVSMAQQRQGIDRVLYLPEDPTKRVTVEYKSEPMAAKTGNSFVETIAYDNRGGKLGWAFTCSADWLVYYIPPQGRVMLFRPEAIREQVPAWARKYRHRIAQNPSGYNGHGILVPVHVMETVALKQYWIS